MSIEPRGDVMTLLKAIEEDDRSAKDQLLEVAYDELRAQADEMMRRERPDRTLQPTALVHEAALRLDRAIVEGRVRGRSYFFGRKAREMRRILVDHARESIARPVAAAMPSGNRSTTSWTPWSSRKGSTYKSPPEIIRKWEECTLAMAAGLTDHRWTMTELLGHLVPPSPWVAPRRWDRPPRPKNQPEDAVAA